MKQHQTIQQKQQSQKNNMNAYEIRLKILEIANSNTHQKYGQQIDVLRSNASLKGEELDSGCLASLTPTTSEIIQHAQELYTFVEGNSN